jgi:hypothetical protein
MPTNLPTSAHTRVALDDATLRDFKVAFDAGTLNAVALVERSLARIAAFIPWGVFSFYLPTALSLGTTGMPCIGERRPCSRRSASSARAVSSAPGCRAMTAFRHGP